MEKKTKKKIIFILGIILVILAIILFICTNRKDGIIDVEDYKFQDNGNMAAEGMEPINKTIKLGKLMQDVKDQNIDKLIGIEDSKANELLNLREYVGLEKMVAQYVDNENFTEIWLFKISKEAESIDLFRIFNSRIDALKNQYKNNETINSILANEQNIVIKQQNGIVIIIVSNEAESIEKVIDANFVK